MSPRAAAPALAGVAAAAVVLSCFAGASPLGVERVLAALLGQGDLGERIVVWEIRFPRALAAFLVGAALGLSGAALQGLLRNPLAEPGVLGVSGMSALGAAGALYFGLSGPFGLGVPVAAILAAVLSTAGLAAAAVRVGSSVSLILVGVGVSSLAGALMALLMNFAPNPFTLADLVSWSLGSVANRSLTDIALCAPFLAAGAAILVSAGRALPVLGLGEEAAAAAGLDVGRARGLIVVGAGLATGGAVALAGAIGFVGIVAPHLVRPLVKHDPARALIPAGLLGGVALVGADALIRSLGGASELKLGVAAALIGAPLFVWIAASGRLRHG